MSQQPHDQQHAAAAGPAYPSPGTTAYATSAAPVYAPAPGSVTTGYAHGYPATAYAVNVVVREPQGLSITSMILGIANFFFGWTLIVPIIGLILGIVGYRKERMARGFSITGIVLNVFTLLGWVVGIVLSVVIFGAAFLPFLAYATTANTP